MDNLTIKTHNFEKAKANIKAFAEELPEQVDYIYVQEKDSIIGEFNHKVTGAELNAVTDVVTEHLVTLYNQQLGTHRAFEEIYSALEALDKDYIQAILVSLKSAEEASDKALKAIEEQGRILEILKKFKERLEKLAHIDDIDKLWKTVNKLEEDLSQFINLIYSLETVKDHKAIIDKITTEDNNIRDTLKAEFDNKEKVLLKNIKKWYLLSGCSFLMALTSILLFFLR